MANPQFSENINEIAERIKADIKTEIPEIEFIKNQLLLAFIIGIAGRIFDFHETARKILANFPSTDLLAGLKAITKNLATPSQGFITATGGAGSVIPANEELQTKTGIPFKTDSSATIADTSLTIISLTNIGTEAIATTSSPHLLANNVEVTIIGAFFVPNLGTFKITVISDTSFKYEIGVTGQIDDPNVPNVTANFTSASISVTSDDFGENTNIDAGETLSFTSTIPGVDNDTVVQFAGITGGTDIESQEDFALRIQETFTNPFSLMNVAEIIQEAKKVSGVTRVFVEEATSIPGEITITFMRDNDTNTIPDSNEVQTVKDQLLKIKPAHLLDNNLIVNAPIANSTDFTIISLSPDTSEMRLAITNNLKEFFSTTEVGIVTTRTEYLCAIQETLDSTGEVVKNFDVTIPSGDITPSADEINVLGTITFS